MLRTTDNRSHGTKRELDYHYPFPFIRSNSKHKINQRRARDLLVPYE